MDNPKDSHSQALTNRLRPFCLFFVLLAILGIGAIVLFPHASAHRLLLDYITTLGTWPIVLLIIALFIFIVFREDISFRIRHSRIKTPYGEVYPPSQSDIKEPEIDKAWLADFTDKVINFAWFERTIRYLYRSQYHLLEMILEKTTITREEAQRFYFEYLGRGGTSTYKFETYIGWLINIAKYIEQIGQGEATVYRLTPFGAEFMNFCKNLAKYLDQEFSAF